MNREKALKLMDEVVEQAVEALEEHYELGILAFLREYRNGLHEQILQVERKFNGIYFGEEPEVSREEVEKFREQVKTWYSLMVTARKLFKQSKIA